MLYRLGEYINTRVGQFHVILDDWIEIYSFNNDYFVDQREKIAGMEYAGNKVTGKKLHGSDVDSNCWHRNFLYSQN